MVLQVKVVMLHFQNHLVFEEPMQELREHYFAKSMASLGGFLTSHNASNIGLHGAG